MASARHKRDANARRRPKATTVAAGLALSLTASAVVLGVALRHPSSQGEDLVALDAPTSPAVAAGASDRALSLSRGGAREADPRVAPTGRPAGRTHRAKGPRLGPAVPAVHRVTEWATSDLNLWPSATEQHDQAGLLSSGTKVISLGLTVEGRQEVVVKGQPRWVTAGYLSTDKPVAASPGAADSAAAATAGLSDAPCPDMSVEKGLAADTIRVYRAVCHAFPQVTNYLGWGPRPEHDTGHAIDVMVYGDKALGDQIAAWAQAHAAELNLYDILWYQHIWTPVRASEGWRLLPDRGSPTANHMDHVHLGTN